MANRYSRRGGEEVREPSASKMTRSRGQLGTVYAPGALFTFEGGLGACMSLPDQSQNPTRADIAPETGIQIHLRLREVWQSWFSRAMQGGTPDHSVLPVQCLDATLLRDGVFYAPAHSRFELVDPRSMCYVPAPMDFVCNTCGRFRKYETVRETAADLDQLKTQNCDTRSNEHKGRCRWRQLDVIFVHWSGNWEPPMPGRWEWNSHEQKVSKPSGTCPLCQSRKFYLIDKSPRIGEWVFECENGHKYGDSWLQNDRVTTELLGDEANQRPPRWRRMEPISYRATPAFYPHSEQFIVLSADQRDLLEMLQEGNESDLAGFISEQFGLGARPPNDAEVVEILRRAGHSDRVSRYERMAAMRNSPNIASTPMAEELSVQLREMVAEWRTTPGLVPIQHESPAWLDELIHRRTEFGSRYDPLRLAVEHEALYRSKIHATSPVDGRSPYVRFAHPDKDLAPRTQTELSAQQARTSQLLDILGIADMGVVREFDLCRFTHGFTRMSTDPLIEKSDQQTLMIATKCKYEERAVAGGGSMKTRELARQCLCPRFKRVVATSDALKGAARVGDFLERVDRRYVGLQDSADKKGGMFDLTRRLRREILLANHMQDHGLDLQALTLDIG